MSYDLRKDKDGRECSRCLKYKTWDQFNRGPVRGHRPNCRDCQKLHEKNYTRPKKREEEK